MASSFAVFALEHLEVVAPPVEPRRHGDHQVLARSMTSSQPGPGHLGSTIQNSMRWRPASSISRRGSSGEAIHLAEGHAGRLPGRAGRSGPGKPSRRSSRSRTASSVPSLGGRRQDGGVDDVKSRLSKKSRIALMISCRTRRSPATASSAARVPVVHEERGAVLLGVMG